MAPDPHDTATARPLQPEESGQHVKGTLRTPYLLARWPLIGLLMVLMGSSLFGVLAINLQPHSSLIQVDAQVVNDLHRAALQSSPVARDVMIFGFYLGEQGVVAIGAALALYFLFRRYWTELSMVLIGWLGEGGIWLVLSEYFNRARPVFAVSVWRQMTNPSFPSGHSFGAVMCFGLLAYLLAPQITSRFWQVVVVMAAALIILYIGFSRIFVGDHYLSDILAGYALGIAWSGLVYTSVERISRRMKKRKKPEVSRRISTRSSDSYGR